MKLQLLAAAFILGGVILFSSCEQPVDEASVITAMKNYNLAIQSGVHGSSYCGEFNRLFPGAQNLISYYSGAVGPSSWSSAAGLYGRYVLKMVLAIQLDAARTNIVSTGSPTFYLYEFEKVTFRADGAPIIEGRQMTTFSADGWRHLVEAKGDFGSLGIMLETNKPVQGFEDAWRRL
jgi:hypothetical protein